MVVVVSAVVLVVAGGATVIVPLTGCEPLQPPEAVQNCASVAFHSRVTFCPASTELGVNCRLMEGLTPDAVPVPAASATGVKALLSQPANAASAPIAANSRAARKNRTAPAPL